MSAFHWKDGWYFERIADPYPGKYGWVHIYHAINGVIDIEIEIDPTSWASIIASVCPEGETAYTFGVARALHGVLSYRE